MSLAFERLISLQSESAEANVESLLREYLSQHNPDVIWQLQKSTAAGREDITSDQLNVVIECKRPGSIHVAENEKQLRKYILDRQSPKDHLTWRGFITDGRQWWGYDFDPRKRELKPIKGVIGHKTYPDEAILSKLCDTHIFSRYDPSRLRQADIDDEDLLDKMFSARFKELDEIQKRLESSIGYKTKIKLWEMQLKGSGIIPPSDEHNSFSDHFKRHSFIVIVSRMLQAYLSDDKVTDDALIESASDGFQAWVLKSEDGLSMLARLAQDLRQYSWRTATRDVLKSLYHGLIPSDKRKEFGEYYTPDHLAAAVVAELLDDAWCDKQIRRAWNVLQGKEDDRKGFGVLDPACGSGTFLFHSAKRLRERIAIHHRGLKKHTAQIVSQLVYGIDIHPIAVEMSQATLLMALPYAKTPIHLNVALGDSMQTEKRSFDLWSSKGLNIKTPSGNQILLSESILYHKRGLDVISWAVQSHTSADNEEPEQDYGSDSDCTQLADKMEEIINEEENHVWIWHLSNHFTLHHLISHSVGRIAGNPPWLVRNDTPDGYRKQRMDEMRKSEGMYDRVGGYLAQGDLASLFTARVTRLYLDTTNPNNRYAWVLPGSALINQVWNKWRKGALADSTWMHHLEAWSLDDITPPIFEHSPNGTSVVFGKKRKTFTEPKMKLTMWSGNFDTADIRETRPLTEPRASDYLKQVNVGCMFRPFHYYVIDEVKTKNGPVWAIRTQTGTKNQWKGKSHEGNIEKDAVLPLASSKDLSPPHCRPSQFLIAPTKDGEILLPTNERRKLFPNADSFWRKCNREFKNLRTDGATDLLETNYGFPNSLSRQLQYSNRGKVKVVYNSSGNWLKAARISCRTIVNSNCYWIICSNVREARYLVGVINAPNMQETWRKTKTSKLHFHLSPFKAIPIPKFNPNRQLHNQIANSVARLETGGGG